VSPPAASEGGEGTSGPLIVTALLPAELQARMDALRRAHFPPERNYLRAHVTLFHALPPSCEAELRQVLARIVAQHPPPPARVEGVMSLGRGTAVRLESRALLAIRDDLADHFGMLLTVQDQHRPRLHVTVQNKVTPKEAKTLQAQLSPQLHPQEFRFAGLALNAYRGGPWHLLKSWSFRG
jgi:hypothetical protein